MFLAPDVLINPQESVQMEMISNGGDLINPLPRQEKVFTKSLTLLQDCHILISLGVCLEK